MDDKTKIADATYPDDISALKLDTSKNYTMKELYLHEAKNITKAYQDRLNLKFSFRECKLYYPKGK